ncbi:MAG: nucleotide pyrophosphohydrolase [Planctomycetota bacterium]|nr:MAG: nucleotide pyrophosphohydrolase [Planctomycetota bacterium]
MQLNEFQRRIEEIYLARDRARGLEATFMWFVEEVGELARELLPHRSASARAGSGAGQRLPPDAPLCREFADVLAWLSTLASIAGVDLQAAACAKYGAGCPRCRHTPCRCTHRHEGS